MIDMGMFTHDTEIAPGEVALVFGTDGMVRIRHNIEAIRTSNRIQSEQAAGFVQALACVKLMADNKVFEAAMEAAIDDFKGLSLPIPIQTRH